MTTTMSAWYRITRFLHGTFVLNSNIMSISLKIYALIWINEWICLKPQLTAVDFWIWNISSPILRSTDYTYHVPHDLPGTTLPFTHNWALQYWSLDSWPIIWASPFVCTLPIEHARPWSYTVVPPSDVAISRKQIYKLFQGIMSIDPTLCLNWRASQSFSSQCGFPFAQSLYKC